MNPNRGSMKRYHSFEADSSSQPHEDVPPEKKIDPYVEPREPSMLNRPLWTQKQLPIYNDILKPRENPYVSHVKSTDVEYIQHNERYFRTTLSFCEKLGIFDIMQFIKDFDAELIRVFFATVHLGTYEARTLTWMTNGRLLSDP
ncbi:hypothetical protein D1007_12311 [Hordeum vulgare]|nr:hypothetical protein D1007_12311 [Hordeum vulgare]